MTCRQSRRRSRSTTASSSRRTRTPTATRSARCWRRSSAWTRSGRTPSMFLTGDVPTPGEYRFLDLAGLLRDLPDDLEERVLLAVDCANERRIGPEPTPVERAKLVVNVDHHHDNSRFGDRQPDRRRRVVDGRDRARHPAEPRRSAHAGDRRGALRRARHRHRPLPVHEHHAEGAAARRRARRRRAPTCTASSGTSTRRCSSRS